MRCILTILKMEKKLRKSQDKIFAGVLGGLGEFFDIDPTLIRVGYVLLSVFSAGFPGVIAYIIMALIIPKKD